MITFMLMNTMDKVIFVNNQCQTNQGYTARIFRDFSVYTFYFGPYGISHWPFVKILINIENVR